MDLPEEEYLTVEELLSAAELKFKGSKFIAHVLHVSDTQMAEHSYLFLKKKHYDATHNCYAYRIDRHSFRYSDDGEPSGTAGKPILQMIEKRNLYQTLVVVTRYFGGTKLGTGGLIHAYGDAANAGLDAAKIKRVIKTKIVKIITSYQNISQFENLINKFQGKIISSDYKEVIHLQIAIPGKYLNDFQQAILPLINIEEN